MHILAIAICLQSISSDVRASEFGFGSGVPITNGIQEVNFNLAKGFRFQAAGLPIGLIEVRLTFTNNTVKRTSLIYAGPVALRTPIRVETIEVAGVLFMVFAVLGVAVLLLSRIRERRGGPSHPVIM